MKTIKLSFKHELCLIHYLYLINFAFFYILLHIMPWVLITIENSKCITSLVLIIIIQILTMFVCAKWLTYT